MNKLICLFLVLFMASSLAVAKEKEDSSKKVKWVKSKTGLNSLITLSKDRGAMIKELKDETKSYDSVKKAINDGSLEKGEDASQVQKKYGEPLLEFVEDKGANIKWVYKPSEGSFFDGEKIYLFFDKDGKLAKWECSFKNEKSAKTVED